MKEATAQEKQVPLAFIGCLEKRTRESTAINRIHMDFVSSTIYTVTAVPDTVVARDPCRLQAWSDQSRRLLCRQTQAL